MINQLTSITPNVKQNHSQNKLCACTHSIVAGSTVQMRTDLEFINFDSLEHLNRIELKINRMFTECIAIYFVFHT